MKIKIRKKVKNESVDLRNSKIK